MIEERLKLHVCRRLIVLGQTCRRLIVLWAKHLDVAALGERNGVYGVYMNKSATGGMEKRVVTKV